MHPSSFAGRESGCLKCDVAACEKGAIGNQCSIRAYNKTDPVQQACTTQKARRAKFININSPRAAKVYFVVVWKKF